MRVEQQTGIGPGRPGARRRGAAAWRLPLARAWRLGLGSAWRLGLAWAWAIPCLAAVVAGSARAAPVSGTPGAGSAWAAPVSGTAAAAVAAQDTASWLRPGDVLRIRVWREPDLSGEFQVDEHGTVVLPRLGPYRVTERSPSDLRSRLLGDYARYLVNPSIEVVFLRRINILGAVRQPGLYPVDPTMTILDVLALAGGALPDGRPDRIRLVREGDVVEAELAVGTRIAESPVRSGDQIWVPERSWLSRNTAVVAAAVSAAVTVVAALILR